jgi:hypothetical protein
MCSLLLGRGSSFCSVAQWTQPDPNGFSIASYSAVMRKSAKRGQPQIFLLCVTFSASSGGVLSHVPSPSRPPTASAEKKSAPSWPRHTLEGVLRPSFFHSESAIRGTRPQKSRHTSITLACRTAVPLRGTQEWGRAGDLSTSLPVRCPTIAVQEYGTYGGQGKAAGFVGRRLCCVNSAFLCSRSHRAKSIRDQIRVRLISKGR